MWTLTHAFQSANMALWSGIPLLVAFSSFATVAVVSSRPLTSDLIFPSISLFMLLQFPLEMVRYFPTGIVFFFSLKFLQVSLVTSNVIEAVVSIKRLSSFLNSEELQMYRTVVETPMLHLGDEVSVLLLVESMQLRAIQVLSIKDADFSWSKDGAETTLEGINLSVKKGELLGVFGRVGAGKVQSNIIDGFHESP